MNLKNILNEIENINPEVFERLSERRSILKSMGKKAIAASLPLAVASIFNKSYAQTSGTATVPATLLTSLNFLLEMEFIQFNFFHIGNSIGNLVPTADQPAMLTIETQDAEHITFLRNLISTLGGTPFTPNYYTNDPLTGNPYAPYSYDFTAGGTYSIYNVYPAVNDYPNYLVMAQSFKDVMVRIYQGQLPGLYSNNSGALGSVMQIMGTEARQAAHIRIIRRNASAPENPKPWITNNIPPAESFRLFYTGEDNVLQYGFDVTTFNGVNGNLISGTAATEAFDEPIAQSNVLSLFAPFILK